MNTTRVLLTAGCLIGAAAVAEGDVLFQDFFLTPAIRLDLGAWTTEIGPASYLGRTQLADWVTPSGQGRFVVDGSGAQLALSR